MSVPIHRQSSNDTHITLVQNRITLFLQEDVNLAHVPGESGFVHLSVLGGDNREDLIQSFHFWAAIMVLER
jgi:hypothetical protein